VNLMNKEPLWISYSLYITVFWTLLFLLVSIFLWNNYVGAFITASIAILGMVLSVLALLFGSKIYVVLHKGRNTVRKSVDNHRPRRKQRFQHKLQAGQIQFGVLRA